jgi:DNA-binding transcriptional MerR regulator
MARTCYINSCYNQSVSRTARTTTKGDGDVHLTIDQLARLAGTTSRNARAFQTLALLPRPTLEGRTGRYGQAHLDRLRAILRLQRQGFSLNAIGALFDAAARGLTLEQILGLTGTTNAHRRPRPDDDLAAFDDWPTRRTGGGVAVIPTTVLDQLAS